MTKRTGKALVFRLTGSLLSAAAIFIFSSAKPTSQATEWPYYGGDQAGSKYSPLADINTGNVSQLQLAWAWKTGETPLPQYGTRPGTFENTPLMLGDVLYLSTPYNKVVALNAETGAELWRYDPETYKDGQPPNGTGYVHRGVAAWRDGNKLRLFLNTRYRLICLDAATGHPVATFGENGVVDLSQGLIWPINRLHYTETSPPVVYKNLVIVGNGVGDRLVYHHDPPGDVRAFDARTGKQAWSFHTIPQAGEFGNQTWGNDSWKFTGHVNVWAPMTLDEARGLLYLPVSTPSNDFYGGSRPGNDLFADSLVCLDANTGKRKWHYQIVHHGLWDYDMPSPPNLVTINVDGRRIDAVVQLTKQGYAYVFDRVTGKPVWPIEERPVPQSNVPGEHSSPTQPVPTKPPAFTDQGTSLEDAFNATPELKAEAQNKMKTLRLGPVFVPPSMEGTLMRPGVIGGANWGGAAFDPETGMLYLKVSNMANIARVVHADHSAANPRASEVDADLTGDLAGMDATFDEGIPLIKPPYGYVVAIDLDHGTIAWKQPFGDSPALRRNPKLQGVKLPEKLGVEGVAGAIVTKGGLIFVGGGDTRLHAVDPQTGKDVWLGDLPARSGGTPMTYRTSSGRQFVAIATGSGTNSALVSFALPEPK